MLLHLRISIIFLLVFFGLNQAKAQEVPERIRVTTNHVNLGLSSISMLDNYISDLKYEGAGLRLSNVSRKRLDTEKGVWVVVSDQLIEVGNTLNSPQTASMFYSNFNFGYGAQKGIKVSDDFRLFVGGTFDFQYVSHQTDRNVNNYFNMNMCTNLNAAFTGVLDAEIWKTDVQFFYDVRIPLVGLSFLPDLGISYYEMYQNNEFSSYVYVTSLHNKQMIQRHFWVQIPLKKVFLNLGMQFESNLLQIKRNHFRSETVSLTAGLSYHFSLFGGRNRNKLSMITEAENW